MATYLNFPNLGTLISIALIIAGIIYLEFSDSQKSKVGVELIAAGIFTAFLTLLVFSANYLQTEIGTSPTFNYISTCTYTTPQQTSWACGINATGHASCINGAVCFPYLCKNPQACNTSQINEIQKNATNWIQVN